MIGESVSARKVGWRTHLLHLHIHIHLHPLPPLPSPYIRPHTRLCFSSYHYPADPDNHCHPIFLYLHHCEPVEQRGLCKANQGQQGLWDWLLPSARPGNGGFGACKDLKGSKKVKGTSTRSPPSTSLYTASRTGSKPGILWRKLNHILWPDQSFRKGILFKEFKWEGCWRNPKSWPTLNWCLPFGGYSAFPNTSDVMKLQKLQDLVQNLQGQKKS